MTEQVGTVVRQTPHLKPGAAAHRAGLPVAVVLGQPFQGDEQNQPRRPLRPFEMPLGRLSPLARQHTSSRIDERPGPTCCKARQTRCRAASARSLRFSPWSATPDRPLLPGMMDAPHCEVTRSPIWPVSKSRRRRSPACSMSGLSIGLPSASLRPASQASGLSDAFTAAGASPAVPAVPCGRRSLTPCEASHARPPLLKIMQPSGSSSIQPHACIASTSLALHNETGRLCPFRAVMKPHSSGLAAVERSR